MSKNENKIKQKGPFASYVQPLKTKQMVTLSLLIAMEIILTRFLSVQALTLRISFGFLPIVIICILYGPLVGGISAGLCDILGMIIFPKGAYFFGFTLTAFISGIIYGLILYRKKINIINVSVAVIIVTIVCDMGLNTLWLSIMYNKAALVLLVTRSASNAIMIPIKVFIILFVYEALRVYLRKGFSINTR